MNLIWLRFWDISKSLIEVIHQNVRLGENQKIQYRNKFGFGFRSSTQLLLLRYHSNEDNISLWQAQKKCCTSFLSAIFNEKLCMLEIADKIPFFRLFLDIITYFLVYALPIILVVFFRSRWVVIFLGGASVWGGLILDSYSECVVGFPGRFCSPEFFEPSYQVGFYLEGVIYSLIVFILSHMFSDLSRIIWSRRK